MNSRERVLAAIAHKEPDRLPIDQGSNRSSGIMAIAYNRLKTHLGVRGGTTFVYDLVQQLAQPEQWYLDRFHVDAVDLGRACTAPDQWQPWTLPDGSPAAVPAWFRPEHQDGGLVYRNSNGVAVAHMPQGSLYFDQTWWPLSGSDGLDHYEPLPEKMNQVAWGALATPPFDQPLTGAHLEEIRQAARYLYETTDYAIALSIGCNLFEWAQWLLGMENLYVYLATAKRKLSRFLDRLTEVHLETLSQLLPRIRGFVQVLVVGDDLGMQTGPQISVEMYREFFLPRHKVIYEYAKKTSEAHILLHSCGGIYELLPSLIEAGVEILNPVQTSASRMEPERLKSEFGCDITFWGGGCDTQQVLAHGTPGEVRADVRRRLEVFMPGGGFIWNPIHNIMADVPPENVVAMLDAAYEFGAY